MVKAKKNNQNNLGIILLGVIVVALIGFIYIQRLGLRKNVAPAATPTPTPIMQFVDNGSRTACNNPEVFESLLIKYFGDLPTTLISNSTGGHPIINWKIDSTKSTITYPAETVVEIATNQKSSANLNIIYLSTVEKVLSNIGFVKSLPNTIIDLKNQSYRYGYVRGNVRIIIDFKEFPNVPNNQDFFLSCGVFK